ncbi:MAG TPA: NAD-dependent epimerase/dehydratase family protein [Gemmatimonadaceae bacterium]|nr:NAD-dependent epimerase/dehydratase family protein [Gemmatimonadaceae bacterium]
MPTRREFLKTGAAASGALLAGLSSAGVLASCATRSAGGGAAAAATPKPLRILVLGGTGFIGPYQVRYAAARGHQITIFTRGRRQADLPASVEHLEGDRNGKLDALKGRRWDAVIDNSATNPDWVRQSATLLKDAADRYMYVSSTGVYYPYRTAPIDETVAPLLELTDPNDGSAKFGVAKAKSEREAQLAFGDRAIVVRPHYIVGPGDTTDRFPYWPQRIAAGGEVLVPGRKSDPVQFIDARDLAEWMVRLLEQRRSGVYNAAGPRETLTMEGFVNGVRDAVGAPGTRFTWVDDYDFLEKQQLMDATPWVILKGDLLGMTSIKFDRALATGLTFRPMADTVRDTLAWWRTVPEARRAKPRFEIQPEKEAAVLAAWKTRVGGRG